MIRAGQSRLKKLEAAITGQTTRFTEEEVKVASYELLVAIAKSQRRPDLTNRAQNLADGIASEIKRQVARHNEKEFLDHLESYVLPTWRGRNGAGGFMLPVVGSEYDDWDTPNLYARRLAVRRRSSVIELIGGPAADVHPIDAFPEIWRHIHVNVIRGLCESDCQ